mmetsp:Transcript_29032/g.94600  ORF Transcript_29032/g.94600 Transcript_29032/m.94600 type:complete len:286 (+) Transcript_29032:406-1263(+)
MRRAAKDSSAASSVGSRSPSASAMVASARSSVASASSCGRVTPTWGATDDTRSAHSGSGIGRMRSSGASTDSQRCWLAISPSTLERATADGSSGMQARTQRRQRTSGSASCGRDASTHRAITYVTSGPPSGAAAYGGSLAGGVKVVGLARKALTRLSAPKSGTSGRGSMEDSRLRLCGVSSRPRSSSCANSTTCARRDGAAHSRTSLSAASSKSTTRTFWSCCCLRRAALTSSGLCPLDSTGGSTSAPTVRAVYDARTAAAAELGSEAACMTVTDAFHAFNSSQS